MTSIVITDTHLTDKPNDEYRWGLWPWLVKQIKEFNADEVLHLGDATDAKDRHPSKLVNRLVEAFGSVADHCLLHVLKGNHDYIDPQNPFFRFLETDPHIKYYTHPTVAELSIGKATFVPAGTEWNFKLHEFPYCFTHVTFDGAEAENGSLLPGVDPALLKDYEGMVYSGDIHVPQKVRRNIEYVGAPYHIRFGDVFKPRVLLIGNNGETENLYYPAPAKHILEVNHIGDVEKARINPRDHVRIRFYLRRTEYDGWRETKQTLYRIADEREWTVFSIEPIPVELSRQQTQKIKEYMSPEQLFAAYADRHRLTDPYIEIGKALMT